MFPTLLLHLQWTSKILKIGFIEKFRPFFNVNEQPIFLMFVSYILQRPSLFLLFQKFLCNMSVDAVATLPRLPTIIYTGTTFWLEFPSAFTWTLSRNDCLPPGGSSALLWKLSLNECLVTGGSSSFCHLLRTGDPWDVRNWLRRSDGDLLNPPPIEEDEPAKVLLNPGRDKSGESAEMPFGIRGWWRVLTVGFCAASTSQYVVTFPFPWKITNQSVFHCQH